MILYIVSHKDYKFLDLDCYKPIQVGYEQSKERFSKLVDSEGRNISYLNPYFCELTALYWLWKNSKEDILGLVHYRRYFKAKNSGIYLNDKLISDSQDFDFSKYDIIVAKPRNYMFVSIRKHYEDAHDANDLIQLENILKNKHPEYLNSYYKIMKGRKLSLYNMFVAKKHVIDLYCAWVFPILFELKNLIPFDKYDSYQKRVFGFLGERLFNVWLDYNKTNIVINYRKIAFIESENYLRKSVSLLKRSFL